MYFKEKIRVAIADDNCEFCDIVAENIRKQENMEIIFIAHDGKRTIDFLREGKNIDILILDLIMPNVDGFGVLEALNNMKLKKYPRVIMISAVAHDSIIQKATDLGAQFYLVKPINVDMLIRRITQISENAPVFPKREDDAGMLKKSVIKKDSIQKNDLEMDVTNFMHEIGIPANIKGFQYLRDAILLCVENINIVTSVTKELYPTVAEMHDTTPQRAERAIRHAVELSWNKGETETLRNLFGFSIRSKTGRPTSSEFIAIVSDRIRLERKVV